MSNLEMSIDDFLKHQSRAGSKKTFLKKWKDEPPYSITVWLSLRKPIIALWRHQFPRIEIVEDKSTGNKSREVWNNRLVCWENENVLRRQGWRDRMTGERDVPPEVCPHCKMIDWVRMQVFNGTLAMNTPVFKFEGTDPTKTKILHAGGLYNGFGSKDLTPEQKKLMADTPPSKGGPIYARDAWMQNSMARLEYMFCVVDNDDPSKGVQVAIESNLLGDKVKNVIAHAMKQLDDGTGKTGERLGNPLITPYAIRWEHNPSKEVEFTKKYDALRMERIRLRPEVEKLIRDTDPPDTNNLTERFNAETHRANLERYALIKMPFDEFFAASRNMKVEPARLVPEVVTAPVVVQPPPEEEMVGCDDCGEPMKATDPKCLKCGRSYEVIADPPSPPPPALRKRSDTPKVSAPAASLFAADDSSSDVPF